MSDDSPDLQFHDVTPVDLSADVSVLAVGAAHGAVLTPDGEIQEISKKDAGALLKDAPLLVCHAAFTARRLGANTPQRRSTLFDVLELFAFVRPAQFCLPTPRGLAEALTLTRPVTLDDEALIILEAAQTLITELEHGGLKDPAREIALATSMGRAGWAWAGAVLEALGESTRKTASLGFDVWHSLNEWEEFAPQGQSDSATITAEESRTRLSALLAASDSHRPAEARPAQSDYAALAADAFAPAVRDGQPHMVLAEAGTGIGKTLGYIAPASVWADKNGPGTWISTYTKNLQRQIDQELDRLYPNPPTKAKKALLRKGRENYVCLLNFQAAVNRRDPIEMGLVARWIGATRDGDMVGGDFPAWLSALFPRRSLGQVVSGTGLMSLGLTDRRGECIYAACTHYRKCFIEKAVRRARRADIVVANHALVMMQAATDYVRDDHAHSTSDRPTKEDDGIAPLGPTRYIFDEGHHLFDAADSAFSSHLSGLECAELRRWLRGPEERRQRGRGLRERLEDVLDETAEGDDALMAALKAARYLPASGWTTRLSDGHPDGPTETFLALVHQHVTARDGQDSRTSYDQEASPWPPLPEMLEAAQNLDAALGDIAQPLKTLARLLRRQLDEEAKTLESSTRARIEAMARGLERRAILMLPAWQNMLRDLQTGPQDGFVDWLRVERAFGRLFDVGMHRHWIDPTLPFARAVLEPAHGVVITSATLRDDADMDTMHAMDDDTADAATWENAEMRTGAAHMPVPPLRRSFESPFDYAAQTRVIVVTDVPRDNGQAVASAYRELFRASGGGALGIFTAIARLRNVYERIAADMDDAGLPLYAQHMDAMDTGTLVDIFRSDLHACLLGTDAVRDGVDVPGQSLRLIVFDRVPWPRPNILHKARRDHFGGRHYDDMITRLRLKQAFGRLVRRSSDRGVFVMLDSRTPSRLLSALPTGVTIDRCGLADAIALTQDFLKPGS